MCKACLCARGLTQGAARAELAAHARPSPINGASQPPAARSPQTLIAPCNQPQHQPSTLLHEYRMAMPAATTPRVAALTGLALLLAAACCGQVGGKARGRGSWGGACGRAARGGSVGARGWSKGGAFAVAAGTFLNVSPSSRAAAASLAAALHPGPHSCTALSSVGQRHSSRTMTALPPTPLSPPPPPAHAAGPRRALAAGRGRPREPRRLPGR